MASTRRNRIRNGRDVSSGSSSSNSQEKRNTIKREFSELYRDRRFPAGWYVLPLVGFGVLSAIFLFTCAGA